MQEFSASQGDARAVVGSGPRTAFSLGSDLSWAIVLRPPPGRQRRSGDRHFQGSSFDCAALLTTRLCDLADRRRTGHYPIFEFFRIGGNTIRTHSRFTLSRAHRHKNAEMISVVFAGLARSCRRKCPPGRSVDVHSPLAFRHVGNSHSLERRLSMKAPLSHTLFLMFVILMLGTSMAQLSSAARVGQQDAQAVATKQRADRQAVATKQRADRQAAATKQRADRQAVATKQRADRQAVATKQGADRQAAATKKRVDAQRALRKIRK